MKYSRISLYKMILGLEIRIYLDGQNIDQKIDESLNNSETLIGKIKNALSDDLLTKEWREKKSSKDDKTFGHCYAASEALYHLLGGKSAGLTPQVGRDENGTHWWLKDKSGKILDPTAGQFTIKGKKPPYENGKSCGFLTKNPSKRAQKIIDKIK